MTVKRLEEIEKQVNEIPKINITPSLGQAFLIFIVFFALAIAVTFLAESL